MGWQVIVRRWETNQEGRRPETHGLEEQDLGTGSLSLTRREDMFEEVISTSPKKPALQPRAE